MNTKASVLPRFSLPMGEGCPHPLGATLQPQGVNFALAAPNAHAVTLCVFDASGQQEIQRLTLPRCSDGVWHGCLPGAQAGLVYGYRVDGPWDPAHGHRFNPAKLLLDPCARDVLGHYDASDIHCGHTPGSAHAAHPQADARDNAATALKARVVAPLPQTGATQRPRVPAAQRVLYELHVKGYTRLHPDVPAHLRGSYAGLAQPAVLTHLRRLGVNTVCLMPIAMRADEERLQRMGLSNYWGYSPIAWSAPEPRYWSGTPGSTPRSEVRAMVDALHAAGLEVVLDVVYNHTAETDALGPTLSLRGIDNATYYHLEPGDASQYLNWTGCGNSVNLCHPLVLRTVMDSLRLWVQEYGVDGFRFDLAPVLGRGGADTHYRFASYAALWMAIAQDPVLCQCVLVAEPWDIGPGGYQLGAFMPGWLEWNDQFRDTVRKAWLLHAASRGALAQRLAGSSDVFSPAQRAPHSSVNLVTAHDGFTLMDLVSYRERHNLDNGENNRDGHAHNHSINHGSEGPSTDAAVLHARARHQRSLLATGLLSLGTPLLLAGDELGHSQGGNNNAYCQDNATTWLQWDAAQSGLCAFVARVISLRQTLSVLHAAHWWRAQPDAPGAGPVAHWCLPEGGALTASDWEAPCGGAMAVWLIPVALEHAAVCLLLNPTAQAQDFCLPAGAWRVRLDTALEDQPQHPGVPCQGSLTVQADSVVLLSAHTAYVDAAQHPPIPLVLPAFSSP